MCLISFAIEPSAEVQWLIVANRDESYGRPTQGLTGWRTTNGTRIVGGRDLKDGGVWMAEQPDSGRLAFLTNVRRGAPETGARSRGELALAWLEGGSLAEWLSQHKAGEYAGCNLVLAEPSSGQWWWLSNRDEQQEPASAWLQRPLARGLYGLSNASLDTPWPKTLRLKAAVQFHLEQHPVVPSDIAGFRSAMLTVLSDRTLPPETDWPDTQVPRAAEAALAPVFVHWPEQDYGTRTSTVGVKLVGAASAMWTEQAYDRSGAPNAIHTYPAG